MALLRSLQDRFLSEGTSSRRDHEEHADVPEHQVSRVAVAESSKNPWGPIHDLVEVCVPSETSDPEMALPSYDEAVLKTTSSKFAS